MLKQIIPKNKTRLSELIREQTDLGHFQIQKIISGKSVKINGQRVNQDVVLKGDETVYIYIKDREKDKIDIVYQDKNVIAVNKPAGMEVTGEDSLAEKLELQHEDMKFFPVHRLDRNTTGLVIFALTPQAEAELNKAFKEKWVDKFYNAVVVGRPNVSQAQLKAFLFKDAKKSLAIVSKTAKPGYVPIETHYRVLKQSGEVCLLEVRLITGRTHQIRAHLASEKLPVLGDGKYGINQINKKYRQNRQMLACVRLQFSFPKNSPLSYLNKRPIRLDADLLAQLKAERKLAQIYLLLSRFCDII